MVTPSAYSLNDCLSLPSMDRPRVLHRGCSGLHIQQKQVVILKLWTASNNTNFDVTNMIQEEKDERRYRRK